MLPQTPSASAPRPVLMCGGHEIALGARTYVMGVLNVTPDSFSDGGHYNHIDAAVAHAQAMLAAGADIIDVGGESTRPGAAAVSPMQEQARVLPVIEGLVARGIRAISVDTRRASTARQALAAGASWLNDVSALADPEMPAVAATADATVLMHMRGTPETMQAGPIAYDNVVDDVRAVLDRALARGIDAGLSPDRVLFDPGIGFGKTLVHNLELTRALSAMRTGVAGVLYGPSRKRFLGELTGIERPDMRDMATVGAIAFAACHGADIVRVHNVAAARQALLVVDALAHAA